MITKQCTQCSKTFKIEDQDTLFYKKIAVPDPKRCPTCRMQRRLAWRNERVFYKDNCTKCKRSIVSQFSPEEQLIVYCETCYWADDWSGQDYGREFDFGKTFTEQFNLLNRSVPHLGMIHTNSENCEYTHLAANNKDSYLLIESSNNENCLYGYWLQKSTDCVDTSYSQDSQCIYASDDLTHCYQTVYSRSSQNCLNCYFMLNCRNCQNCFGCVNLNNTSYCIFNEQKTQAEYKTFIASLQLDTWAGVQRAEQLFQTFAVKQPRRYAEMYNASDSTGNYLHHANQCMQIFHGYEAERASYGEHVWRQARDVMDVSTVGIEAELVYDSINCALGVQRIRFSNQCWNGSSDVDYSMYCGSLTNGFGCVAIKSGKNLILNKRYTTTEFVQLKHRIITHMQATGEWGNFLDSQYSLFGYNETAAMQAWPLTQEQARQNNFRWRTQLSKTTGKETMQQLPDSIHDVAETITKEILACQRCQKNYQIITAELVLLRRFDAPLPRYCPDCRHAGRIMQRNSNQLWQRQCMCTQPEHNHAGRCSTEFETTYSPDRKELIYCEACYQKEIY